ncbi:hypothetical protein TNCV_991301 [Trichonephila clavipes]|nr:hypothetical protein TNCV_991301 [Trichonephila clavipes]
MFHGYVKNLENAEQIKRIDQEGKNLLQFMGVSPFCSSLPSIQHFPANKNIVLQQVQQKSRHFKKQKLANDTTCQEDYNCEKRGSPYREMPPYHNSSRRLQLREKRESLQRDATVPCGLGPFNYIPKGEKLTIPLAGVNGPFHSYTSPLESSSVIPGRCS